jgi:LysR family glycine cleavage system transcriptional activator
MSESLRRQIPSPVALFVFEAVARHGGFRAAAQEMNVTQPSVSYQIKNLERHLGTRLFERRGRSIALTDDGETLFRAVERGFAAIQTGLTEIAHRASGNLVTFCLSSSAAANFVLPRYPALRQALPGLDLSIKIVNRDINPASENADFAIRLGHGPWEDLDAWPMFDEVYFPVCAPGYFGARKVTLSDVRASNLLFLRERLRPRDDWRSFFDKVGAPLTQAHERIIFDDQQALLASAMDGQGVGLGWLGMADHLLATGALARPVDAEVRTGRTFYLVAPKGLRPSRMATGFRHWLLQESAAIQLAWQASRGA